jgi:hypothetical protein
MLLLWSHASVLRHFFISALQLCCKLQKLKVPDIHRAEFDKEWTELYKKVKKLETPNVKWAPTPAASAAIKATAGQGAA